jgi:hypothetical protein
MSETRIARRTFLRTSLAAVSALPLGAIPRVLRADDRVNEDDPAAIALGYRHDTMMVDAAKFPRHSQDQNCRNCQLFQDSDAQWAACAIFPGKHVNAGGWCKAWVKKAG